MAVMGARPARSPWFLGGRRRMRPRRSSRAPARRIRRSTLRLNASMDVRPLLVAIVVAAALAIFYLSQSTGVAARGYEIDDLAGTLAARRAEQQQLIMAVAQARSPAEITRRARFQLGLLPLDGSAITFATPSEHSAD
jgi:hypothetical protein